MGPDRDSEESEPPDEPVTLLRDLELEPERDLPARVRRSIERRFLSRDLITFCWTAITELVMEWLSALAGHRTLRRPPERDQR